MNEKKALEGEVLFTGAKPVLQGRKKLAERVENGGGGEKRFETVSYATRYYGLPKAKSWSQRLAAIVG